MCSNSLMKALDVHLLGDFPQDLGAVLNDQIGFRETSESGI
jgi:hypothetical protein